jgi:putative phosphoesterase
MAMPSTPTRVLVVGDTHLRAATLDHLPAEVWAFARTADLILHTGDVLDDAVLEALADVAPLRAVLGNNDIGLVATLPEVIELQIGGVDVAMIHDSGPTSGRHRRMARRFPGADVVLFGHSHAPLIEQVDGGPLLVNPGSPTQRRRQPEPTIAWLELDRGAVIAADIHAVGPHRHL